MPSCSYCNKPKVVAKGLCNACYYRLKKNGTLEYKPKKVSPLHCKLEGCDRPVVSRGYCSTHYANDLKLGDPVSTFGYGERSDHPLYGTWSYQRRTEKGRVSEWDDFWCFVESVPEKPSDRHSARRYDFNRAWGPDNFYWIESAGSDISRNEYMRKWRKKNPLMAKSNSLNRAYGISFDKYMQMYSDQSGKCAICGEQKHAHCSETGRSQTLVVDHCHDKKHIRALLCSSCNKGLGHFFDSPELMQKAVEYLKSHQK